MYENIEIQNFRGFKKFSINGFKRVNLISGRNDTGKTTLLEALFIHGGKNNPQLVIIINVLRGVENIKIPADNWSEMPWDSVFYKKEINNSIEISGIWNSQLRKIKIKSELPNDDDSKEMINITPQLSYSAIAQTLKPSEAKNFRDLEFEEIIGNNSVKYRMKITSLGITISKFPNADFPTYFISAGRKISTKEDAELFGKLDLVGDVDEIKNILRIIEPRLKRLSVVFVNNEPIIHGDIGIGELLPLPYLGDGLSRLLSLVLRISNSKNGLVIIDEIENGFHYSVHEKIWRAIDQVSEKYNVQIFATTHSYECIKYSYRAFSKKHDDFIFFRLDRDEDVITAKFYDKEKLGYALETDVEVR